MVRNRAVARRTAAALGAMLLFVCRTTAVSATTLVAPTTMTECNADGVLVDDPTSCAASGSGASASASLSLLPFVGLSVQSSSAPVDANFSGSSGALAIVTYAFQIVGGTPGTVVPILISTNLTSAASSTNASGLADTQVHTSFGDDSEVVCTTGTLCPTTNTSFSGTFGWSAIAGETGDTIQIKVEANSVGSLGAEWADASADPFIFIDPAFADAANYSIVVSPGVGNGEPMSSVPEPGTFGLAGTALAMLGTWRRSRRRSSQPVM